MSEPSVIVCGMAGAMPLGGMGLHYLQYCLGLRDLGIDVMYLEDSWNYAYDPVRRTVDGDASYTIAWVGDLFEQFDLEWAYMDPAESYHGMTRTQVHARCADADLLLNLSGALYPFDHHREAGTLAFVDTDSAFNQVRVATGNQGLADSLAAHDIHFTFAEAIGSPTARIPEVGIDWRPTRQPIHLPLWENRRPLGGTYTTVMNWDAYGTVEWDGEIWGQKDAEFPMVADLPSHIDVPLEIAVAGPAPRDDLRAAGWRIREPLPISRTIWDLRDYILASRGELTVQKQAFVQSRSGWFAERSANYLASGRPVVAQDTGWSRFLPTGEGLFAFDTTREAADGLRAIEDDPTRHAKAARGVAESHFDARNVLEDMLSQVGL